MEQDWRAQRKAGMTAIAIASAGGAALWLGIRYLMPPLNGAEAFDARMLVALKCV